VECEFHAQQETVNTFMNAGLMSHSWTKNPVCMPGEKLAEQGPRGKQSTKITGGVPLTAVEEGFGDSNKSRCMDNTCS